VTSVDEYRSPTRGVQLRVAEGDPRAPERTFVIDAPIALKARLEVFDAQGRRVASLLNGLLAEGRSRVTWEVHASAAPSVPSGVYFARLAYRGGQRTARLVVVH
jgi:hypothetical protein